MAKKAAAKLVRTRGNAPLSKRAQAAKSTNTRKGGRLAVPKGLTAREAKSPEVKALKASIASGQG